MLTSFELSTVLYFIKLLSGKCNYWPVSIPNMEIKFIGWYIDVRRTGRTQIKYRGHKPRTTIFSNFLVTFVLLTALLPRSCGGTTVSATEIVIRMVHTSVVVIETCESQTVLNLIMIYHSIC